MKKGLIAIVILAVVGFFAIKTIGGGAVDKGIENLKAQGTNCKITKDEGFLTQTRDVECKIEDAKKFKQNILNQLSNKSQDLKPLYNAISKALDNNEFYDVLQGLHFKGTINSSNMNPFGDVKTNIYLSDIDASVADKNNEVLKRVLDKKLVNFDMVFSNKGVLKNLKLKDIDETFTEGKETIDSKIVGLKINNSSNSDKVIMDASLEKMLFKLTKENKNIHLGLDGMDYDIEYLNPYNNKGNMTLGKLKVGESAKTSFEIGKSIVKVDTSSSSEKLKTKIKYEMKDIGIDIKEIRQNVKIGDMELDVKIEDLDLATYKELNDLSMKIYMKATDMKDRKDVEEILALQQKSFDIYKQFLNKGLKTDVKLDIEDVKFQNNNLENIELDIDLDIKPNNANISALSALGIIDLKADLEMEKKDFETIGKFVPRNFYQMAQTFVNFEKGKAVFKLVVKDGKPTINTKPLM